MTQEEFEKSLIENRILDGYEHYTDEEAKPGVFFRSEGSFMEPKRKEKIFWCYDFKSPKIDPKTYYCCIFKSVNYGDAIYSYRGKYMFDSKESLFKSMYTNLHYTFSELKEFEASGHIEVREIRQYNMMI